MGISKISNLFAANTDAVPSVTPTKAVAPQVSQAQGAPQGGSDAVVLSSKLDPSNRVPLEDPEKARAARVQQLKSEVRGGKYKADPEKVAVSVMRDLM